MYVLSTGCQWRAIPKDLPPRSTVYDYLDLWSWDGTLDRIHEALYTSTAARRADREASPSAAIIDSQSVTSARTRGAWIDPPGYDAGKKIKGKKRHLLVDTLGLLLHAIVHPAHIQDRDGGASAARHNVRAASVPDQALCRRGLSGSRLPRHRWLACCARIETEIVKRSDHVEGFAVPPKRWIVERTIAWLNRCRRLAKDWENLNRKGLAFLASPPSASCSENYAIQHDLSGQTLRLAKA